MRVRSAVAEVWWLYRAYNEAGDLLYIGQTGRRAVERWAEHMAKQPWAHEVAMWVRDKQVFGSEADVLRAEKHAIETERPRYNIEHNQNNPHRVVVQRSDRQRRAPARPPIRNRRRRDRLFLAGCWAVLWGSQVFALTVWVWLHVRLPFGESIELGLAVPSLLTVFIYSKTRPRRRRRRWTRTVR